MSFTPPTPQWIGSLGSGVTEIPDSGQYTLAWGYKWTQKEEGQWATFIANGNDGLYNRGVISAGYIINEARITRARGGKGRLEIDWQSIDTYLNPDEWDCPPEDIQPRIERHPLFQPLQPPDFAAVQQAITALNSGALLTAQNKFAGSSNPALSQLLYTKMRNGFENYYLASARYTWSSYYLPGTMPAASEGGYTEEPGGPGAFLIPQNFSWLRLADHPGQANWSPLGGILKLTRMWLGGPSFGGTSFWDPDIYPPA